MIGGEEENWNSGDEALLEEEFKDTSMVLDDSKAVIKVDPLEDQDFQEKSRNVDDSD